MVMMPITTAPNSPGTQGFTLIELLVVLSIMALLSAVAIQSFGRRPDALGRLSAKEAIRAAITKAQAQASASGHPASVELGALDAGVLAVQPIVGNATGRLLFYPDHSSTGGTIERGGRALLSVDWLTSRVSDAS